MQQCIQVSAVNINMLAHVINVKILTSNSFIYANGSCSHTSCQCPPNFGFDTQLTKIQSTQKVRDCKVA